MKFGWVTGVWGGVYRLLAREPVQLGAFVLSVIVVVWNPGEAGMAVAINGVGWVQRMFSSPKRSVEAAHESGRNEAIAEVSLLSKP